MTTTGETETRTVDVEISKFAAEVVSLQDQGWEIVESEKLDSNGDMFRLKLAKRLKVV
jgi:hypothetical protein